MFLEICDAGREFDGRWAVRDVSTSVRAGSILAVLGANGAGKTTLLRLLAGWLPLSAGAIRFDGSPMRTTASHLRRRVMLLDETPRRNVRPVDVLGRLISDYRADRKGIEDEVADWFDALEVTQVYCKEPASLSKGQWYKMMLVGLFVIHPELWLLDEPFSAGLDARGLQTLETQICAHRDSGGIVVVSSQWPDHARRLADRVLVLHEGERAWEAEPTAEVPADHLNAASPSLRAVLQELNP